MSEPFWYIEHSARPTAREFHRRPLAICFRILSKIDDDIEDRSLDAPDNFGFLSRCDLIIRASKCSLFQILRKTALCTLHRQPILAELVAAERPGKKTAIIFYGLHVNDEGAFEFRLGENHRRMISVP